MGSKRYYFYARNKVLQDICDELQASKQLTEVVNKLLMNNLGDEVQELRQQAEKRAKDIKKAETLYKKLCEEKENGRKKTFEDYKKYRQNTGYTKKKALVWIEQRANKLGEDPETLLEEFEDRIKNES